QIIYQPTRITSDGVMLAIGSDTGGATSGHPITVWNSFPNTNFAAYDHLLDPGSNPMPGRNTFVGGSPLVLNGRMFISDPGFSGLLMWNSIPQSLTPADNVLGQASATTGLANQGGMASANSFDAPEGSPATDGTMLYVPDTQNHRILGYSTL